MKRIITALFLSCLTAFGANPSFESFDTNYFRLTIGPNGPTGIALQTNLFSGSGGTTNIYQFYATYNNYVITTNIDAGNIQGTDGRISRFVGAGSSLSNSIAYETNGALVVEGSDLGGGAGIYTPGWYSTTNRLNGPVNILSFGADPTGLTDSTAAIQDAIDHASCLLIPPGSFVTSSPLIVSNKLGFTIVGAGNGLSSITAGSAFSGAMLQLYNVENAQISGLTIDADSKAENGVLIETVGGLGQVPSDGGLIYSCEIRQAINGYGLALSVNPSAIPNPQVNNWLIQSCKLYSSKTNVIQRSSNALRNRFVNTSFSDFLGVTDWHFYGERGEILMDSCEFAQAKEYDLYRGVGTFLHASHCYSESQRCIYSDAHDPNPYPIDIIGWHQNVINNTNSAFVFNQNGPVLLDSCMFGGDVYLANNLSVPSNPNYLNVTVRNCNFFFGTFIGPGTAYLNYTTASTSTATSLVGPLNITHATTNMFTFNNTGLFMGLNQAWYDDSTHSIFQSKAIPWRWYDVDAGFAAMDLSVGGDLSIYGSFGVPGRYSVYTNANYLVSQTEHGLGWTWYDLEHTATAMTLTNGTLIVTKDVNAAAANLTAGTGAGIAKVGGTLKVNTSQVGNGADLTEDDLMSFTVPANTLSSNGDYLEVDCWGEFANNGNTKTLQTYFGGTLFAQDGPAVRTAAPWHLKTVIVRTSSTDVLVESEYTYSGSVVYVNNQSISATLANALIFKCTGTSGSSGANDVVQKLQTVKWYKGQ